MQNAVDINRGDLSPNQKRQDKENLETDIIKKRTQMSTQDLLINDISGYTTKSRKNLVDNNSNSIINIAHYDNCSSAILQEMNTDDDLMCNSVGDDHTDEHTQRRNESSSNKSYMTEAKMHVQSHANLKLSHSKPKLAMKQNSSKRDLSVKKPNFGSESRPMSPENRPKWKSHGKYNNSKVGILTYLWVF